MPCRCFGGCTWFIAPIRLPETYRDQPTDGQIHMTIGLSDFRDDRIADRLHRMLLLPITGRSGDYPINRRGLDPNRLATKQCSEPEEHTGDDSARRQESQIS